MKIIRKIKNLFGAKARFSANERGFTLVEMVVTFALLASLLMMASYILMTYFKIYLKVDNVSRAQTVAAMLSDDIYGRLFLSSGENVIIENNGTVITYFDENNFRVSMSLLVLVDKKTGEETSVIGVKYLEITDPETKKVLSEELDWHFPKKTYQGNNVTELKFELIPNTNLIEYTFTLENVATGYIYTTKKVVECYNMPIGSIITDEKE